VVILLNNSMVLTLNKLTMVIPSLVPAAVLFPALALFLALLFCPQLAKFPTNFRNNPSKRILVFVDFVGTGSN